MPGSVSGLSSIVDFNVYVISCIRCQRVMDEVMKNQGMRLDSRPAPLGCRAGYSNACPWFVELEIG
jgi:hypothetical protein